MFDALKRTTVDDGLSMPFMDFLDVLRRIAVTLESINESHKSLADAALAIAQEAPKKRTAEDRDKLDMLAVALLGEQQLDSLNLSDIARKLGVPRSTLAHLPELSKRWKTLTHAAKRMGKMPNRGFRRDDGDVEAIDD